MSDLSLNNKYIAEALSPEQRKKAQEILNKETGADKKIDADAERKKRAEIRKEKELELKAANTAIRKRREDRRDKGEKDRAKNKVEKEKRDALKAKQRDLAKKVGEKSKAAASARSAAKSATKQSYETISDKGGTDATALAKVGSNVAKGTAAAVGNIANRIKARRLQKQADATQKKLDNTKEVKEQTTMKNVSPKDRKVIQDRGKNLFKKDLTGNVTNANEAMEDPQVESQKKKQDQIKKKVLMAKLRAVRSGGGESITASYNPEISMITEVDETESKENKTKKVIDIMKGKNKIEVNPPIKAEEYTVTNADKKGNTPAWKGYKAGKKNVKTGKPLYKKADHVEEGVGDALKKGVKRHKDAVEKKKIKNRKAVPYAALAAEHEPEGEVIDEKKKGLDGKECWDGYKLAGTKKKGGKTVDNCVKVKEDYYSGTGEKVQKRTLAWMRKKGMKGSPGLNAMKAREAEHKSKRGVKEEAGCETKKIENKGKKKIDPNKNPVVEAKVDQGRSDYGKASIRNYRHSGPDTVDPAMFDPENKRGKTIDKRRAEHKARRGVKGAKVPTYNKEDVTIQDASGKDRLEIIDIIKPEPMKSPKNTVQWTEEKISKIMKMANEKKRKNALQINKIVGTQ